MQRISVLVLAFLAVLGKPAVADQSASRHSFGHTAVSRGFDAASRVFKAKCVSCHGALQPRAGLDLRSPGSIIEGGASGPAVVPGSPEHSLLYRLAASGKMPPAGTKLTRKELQLLGTWIRIGAPGGAAEGHWAFRPPVRAIVPSVGGDQPRVRNPIDAFLLSSLRQKNLGYSPEADRRTLIRRIYYDLVGVPPTPAEVALFSLDQAPNAYERLVDRLLADPRYGERWARHWLDPAGYADSEGILQEDLIRHNAWRYRDYVIRSFNADKPYDRFLREQIAGDELFDYRQAEALSMQAIEALTATGFLRTAVDATRADFNAHQFQEYQLRMLNDVETILSTTVLGLPLHCARCHDHKYEPLSQRDYYRIQAVFAGGVRPDGPLLPSRTRQVIGAGQAEQRAAKETNSRIDAAIAEFVARQATLLREARRKWIADNITQVPEPDRRALMDAYQLDPEKRSNEQKALVQKHNVFVEQSIEVLGKTNPAFLARNVELQKALDLEAKKRIILPELRAFYDQDAKPPDTHLLIRGEWHRKGPVIPPGIPAVLNHPDRQFQVGSLGQNAATTGRRKALAAWITRPDNPLTARVIVNRIWAQHFGQGIVATLDNFGRSGAVPTHQPLLDWLAADLVQNNWSIKALHRLMVSSSAYRQQSRFRASASRLDPQNLLLWRQRPRRLEAEAIRDAMLYVAGNLDPTMFGEAVRTETRAGGDIVPLGEEKGGRRSIYLLVRRSEPVAVLNAFDAPVMETNCTRRTTAATATQALAVMNSSFITTQARTFAAKLVRESAPTSTQDGAVIKAGFQLAFSRMPGGGELRSGTEFVRRQREIYARTSAKDASERAIADFCQSLLASNEFIYID